jgi:hypothetical protein
VKLRLQQQLMKLLQPLHSELGVQVRKLLVLFPLPPLRELLQKLWSRTLLQFVRPLPLLQALSSSQLVFWSLQRG